MSKFTEIETGILSLDGGAFQKLTQDYLYEKGYKSVISYGSVKGMNKTRVGTPDLYAELPDGKYAMIEVTTQQEKILVKLTADFKKCLSEDKTGIPEQKISKLIGVINSDLSVDEHAEIIKTFEKPGLDVEIYCLTQIVNDIIKSFPGIAVTHLGVEVDRGQIIRSPDFVRLHDQQKFATPLDVKLEARDEDLTEALSVLENKDVLILAGPAGVGKTRLGLEVLSKFVEQHPEFQEYCIFNKGDNLSADIQTYFRAAKPFVVLVDDANRISNFDYFALMLLEKKRDKAAFKIVATVRDYACDTIVRRTQEVSDYKVMKLRPLTQQETTELVQKAFDIHHEYWLERIWFLSKGNPRLARMAAKAALSEGGVNSLISAVDLYDAYFKQIKEEFMPLTEDVTLKVVAIISLLGSVDKQNPETADIVQEKFGIQNDEFWRAAFSLHQLEIVDIFENEVVKIGEQVLSTYLFYVCVFEKKLISFTKMFSSFFPKYIRKFQDAFFGTVNAFGGPVIINNIKSEVLDIWKDLKTSSRFSDIKDFINTFWFVLPVEILLYIRDHLSDLRVRAAPDVQRQREELIALLGLFANSEDNDFEVALDILLMEVAIDADVLPRVVEVLAGPYAFLPDSNLLHYARERLVVSKAVEQSRLRGAVCTELFVTISKVYLRTEFEHRSGGKHAINIRKFRLLAIEEILTMRKEIWDHLTELYIAGKLQQEILSVFRDYTSYSRGTDTRAIRKADAAYIHSFIVSCLDTENFSHCRLVNEFVHFFEYVEMDGYAQLLQTFRCEAYEIYKLFQHDYSQNAELNYNDFIKVEREKIRLHIKDLLVEDFERLMDNFAVIEQDVKSHGRWFDFQQGINSLFIVLRDDRPELFLQVLENYFKRQDQFSLDPRSVISASDGAVPRPEILKLISDNVFPSQSFWKFHYYHALPPEQMSEQAKTELYELYRTASVNSLPYHFDALIFYPETEFCSYFTIARIILDRAGADGAAVHNLAGLIPIAGPIFDKFDELLTKDSELIQQMYLKVLSLKKDYDVSGRLFQKIFHHKPNFLFDYLKMIYNREKYPNRHSDSLDFTFIWSSEQGVQSVEKAILWIFEQEKNIGGPYGGYISKFFRVDGAGVEKPQDELLSKIIVQESKNFELINILYEIISRFDNERRLNFLELFLKLNSDFSNFRELSLEPNTKGWSGSRVPMLQAEQEFLRSVLPLTASVNLLEHRAYLNELIVDREAQIAAEMRNDFVD